MRLAVTLATHMGEPPFRNLIHLSRLDFLNTVIDHSVYEAYSFLLGILFFGRSLFNARKLTAISPKTFVESSCFS